MSSLETQLTSLVSRVEKVISRIEAIEKQLASAPAPAAPAAASSGGSSAFVNDYEDLMNQFINQYVELSKKIAPEIGQQAEFVAQAVSAQRDFLKVAAACKKPADATLQTIIKPTADAMGKVSEIKEKERKSKWPNHLAAVSEGIAALGWVLVSPTPGPHVNDMRGGSEFYSNRILKEFKGKEQLHVDWVAAFNGFLKELPTYIKKYHTTGVTWNAKGEDAATFAASNTAAPAAAPAAPSGVPPPPGPPPPVAPPPVAATSGSSDAVDMSKVFSELSKGEDVTKGLRKVTKDMKTKNRTDNVSIVPAKESKATEAPKKGASAAPAKPPKFALEGNKWVVEFHVKNKEIVIDQTEMKHTVYIYKCRDSVIQIKGKVNSVILDDCTKTAVVFENIVASLEVVNCNSVEIQCLGTVPSFAVDKTSGCQIYLSKEALGAEIVTSKSSEMNVMFPDANGEMIEVSIPEQYKSQIKGNKLATEIVAHV